MTRNLVFSNYLSARALRQGLELLGEQLLACDSPGFMVPTAGHAPAAGDRLFFTDEWSLGRFLGRSDFVFFPRALAVTLDDKLSFAERARAAGANPVPFWSIGAQPQIQFPVLLKGRHSWRNGKPMPRGCVCSSAEDLARRLAAFEHAEIGRENFFLQQFLPDGVTNAWSVCGFHDAEQPERNELLVIHKRVATRDGLGYVLAAAVEPDPAELEVRTVHLLRQLSYTGPFELEFLQDRVAGSFHELELNPRFWLQHSIFIHARGNRLLRRYLGLPVGEQPDGPAAVLWVNSVGLIICIFTPWRATSRALLQVLVEASPGRKTLLDPPLPVALQVVARQLLRKLDIRKRGGNLDGR